MYIKRYLYYSLISFCFLFFSNFINAQKNVVEIKGTVYNASNNVIEQAIVKLYTPDINGLVKQFALTNKEGKFSLKITNTSIHYQLQISMLGYHHAYLQLASPYNNIDTIFVLQKSTNTLPAVSVKADDAIIKKGDTTRYKVSAFEQGNQKSVADLLDKMPGINVDKNSGAIFFNGTLVSKVLLEGDDLTGNNYSTIIKNSGTSGIETIELIENYKDNSSLENKFSVGNETVLNLKYKNRALRIYGNVDASSNTLANFYELKTSFISLFKKDKLLINTNNNSIGKTAFNISGKDGNFYLKNDNTEVSALEQTFFPVNLKNITPINISSNRSLLNYSNLVSANNMFKPSKNLIIKTVFSLASDNYWQQSSATQIINNIQQPLTLIRNTETDKNNFSLTTKTEVNWILKGSLQFILSYKYDMEKYHQFRNGTLFTKTTNEENKTKQNLHDISVKMTKIFKDRTIATFKFFNSYYNTNQNYIISNPDIDPIFGLNNHYNYLQQYFHLPEQITLATINIDKSLSKFNLSLRQTYSRSKTNLLNTSFAYNRSDSVANLSDMFQSNNSLINTNINTELNLNYNITSNFRVTHSIKAENISYHLTTLHNVFNNYNKWFILPSTSFTYKFNTEKRISFNIQTTTSTPTLMQLNNKYLFTDLTSINKGDNIFNANKGYSLNVYYISSSNSKKGFFFNTYITQQNIASNYLQNVQISNTYIFTDLIPFNKNNSFTTLGFGINKKLGNLKSWLNLVTSYTFSKYHLNSNNILSVNKGSSLNLTIDYKTNWKKWFNTNISTSLRTYQQRVSDGHINANSFTGYDWITNANFLIKPHKKIMFSVVNELVVNQSNNLVPKKIFFTDFEGYYIINKKLSTSILMKNIFNKSVFSYNEIGLTQSSIYSFQLQPAFILFNIYFKI